MTETHTQRHTPELTTGLWLTDGYGVARYMQVITVLKGPHFTPEHGNVLIYFNGADDRDVIYADALNGVVLRYTTPLRPYTRGEKATELVFGEVRFARREARRETHHASRSEANHA